MMRYVWLVVLVIACGNDPVTIADFRVDASLRTTGSSLNGTSGCRVDWTFTANDGSATVYYSVGPGMTSSASQWWENGSFRGRGTVSLFVPSGRSIDYKLWRVEGTTEIWRKESGLIQVC